MKIRVYDLEDDVRSDIVETLSRELESHTEVLFAYVHGSFLSGTFRDIDVGVFIEDTRDVRYELRMERELDQFIRLPVDLRILNEAPPSFRFKVIKDGELLFSKDERARCDFETGTISEYHDLSYHLENYRREAIGLGL